LRKEFVDFWEYIKMKDKVVEKNVEYPENPPWTMFFDGPLYQEYDKFMKTKDFSQVSDPYIIYIKISH
jgi:hypothetical protein